MTPTNGMHPPARYAEWADDEDPVAQTLQQQMLRDLDEKVDDIQKSVTTMAIAQAVMAGDVKVLNAEFDSFRDAMNDRIKVVETGRSRDEWRAWGERLVAVILGAGGIEVVRRFLGP